MTILNSFTYHFFRVIWLVRTVIAMLIILVVVGAVILTYIEKIPFGDALYFAAVTGLTIGYGDIVMHNHLGRLVALVIGFVGILFTGLMVSVLVYAVRESIPSSRNRS